MEQQSSPWQWELPVGSDTLLATYTQDVSAAGAYTTANQSTNNTVVIAIGMTTSTVTMTASSATITNLQTDTVTVSVSGTMPTGTGTLTGGPYSAQQSLSSGTASFMIAADSLNSGTDTLTASYSGNATYVAASGTGTVTVAPVVMAVPSFAPISLRSSASGNVSLTAGTNYSGTMNLTCTLSASPAGAQSLPTCSFNLVSVVPSAGGTACAMLTVTTTAASTAIAEPPAGLERWSDGYGSSVLAAVLLFGIPSRRRRPVAVLMLSLALAIAGISGCGGGANQSTQLGNLGTTAGSYTFMTTSTDGSAKMTTSASVVISVQ